MSISQGLEVAIGLIFVYYALGSIVSLITQLANETLETRGKALERYLVKIVGEKKVGDFVELPQLKALRPIRYKNLLSFITSATEPKKLEKVPAAVLVDSYFDFMQLTSKEFDGDEIKNFINGFPNSEGKRALLTWVEHGVTKVEDLRKRATDYFNGMTEQAAATFRSNARSIVIILSIALTGILGTDSIQLARTLWVNADARAVIVAQAENAVNRQENFSGDSGVNADEILKELTSLQIVKLGWWQTDLPSNAKDWALKALGLSLTAAAVSQGSSFWYDFLKKLVSIGKGGGGEKG
ncbi:MAG: hypothetical protein LC099_07130 [Anaerolineales bacterium]|nr:hypothetical protein [Anaerolineales bacterium]